MARKVSIKWYDQYIDVIAKSRKAELIYHYNEYNIEIRSLNQIVKP
jgi:hypothetical protein